MESSGNTASSARLVGIHLPVERAWLCRKGDHDYGLQFQKGLLECARDFPGNCRRRIGFSVGLPLPRNRVSHLAMLKGEGVARKAEQKKRKSEKRFLPMVSDESTQAAVYELRLPQELPTGAETKGSERPLPESLLAQNILWFCQVRWLVIGTLVSYGILGLFPGLIDRFGIRPPGAWPFVTAALLTLCNVVFLFFARAKTAPATTVFNLWSQIIADLLILTAVVYFVGGLETNIAFAYLFHIVLSCVFFSRRQSFIVTMMAISMFAACITAEYVLKVLPSMSIFTQSPLEQDTSSVLAVMALDFFFTIGIWLAVWYLASHLSLAVRQRDFELAETNRRLIAAHEERSRHMLEAHYNLGINPMTKVIWMIHTISSDRGKSLPFEQLNPYGC